MYGIKQLFIVQTYYLIEQYLNVLFLSILLLVLQTNYVDSNSVKDKPHKH